MTLGGLAVSEIFGPTLQGEGPNLGRLSGFLRLAGCNLVCGWCDSAYTWDWGGQNGVSYDPQREVRVMTAGEVLGRLGGMGVDRVVVTGGEPMLQQRELLPVLSALADAGYVVEMETNGTRMPLPGLPGLVSGFSVSPKLGNSGMESKRTQIVSVLRTFALTGKACFKFVVSGLGDLDEVADLVGLVGIDRRDVWVMPCGVEAWEVCDRELAEGAIARGWNVTTRLHILLWGNRRGV